MEKEDLAKIFKEMAAATEFTGGSPFKSRTYNLAKEVVEEHGIDLDALENTLGIGKAVVEKTKEFMETGKIKKHDELMELIPGKYKDRILTEDPKALGLEWKNEMKKRFFTVDGRLKGMPSKFSMRYIVLSEIASAFKREKEYEETDVNSILMKIHEDYVALRRYLVDFGFLARKKDGSDYTRGD